MSMSRDETLIRIDIAYMFPVIRLSVSLARTSFNTVTRATEISLFPRKTSPSTRAAVSFAARTLSETNHSRAPAGSDVRSW